MQPVCHAEKIKMCLSFASGMFAALINSFLSSSDCHYADSVSVTAGQAESLS
jgi:hypothetical protein